MTDHSSMATDVDQLDRSDGNLYDDALVAEIYSSLHGDESGDEENSHGSMRRAGSE